MKISTFLKRSLVLLAILVILAYLFITYVPTIIAVSVNVLTLAIFLVVLGLLIYGIVQLLKAIK